MIWGSWDKTINEISCIIQNNCRTSLTIADCPLYACNLQLNQVKKDRSVERPVFLQRGEESRGDYSLFHGLLPLPNCIYRGMAPVLIGTRQKTPARDEGSTFTLHLTSSLHIYYYHQIPNGLS